MLQYDMGLQRHNKMGHTQGAQLSKLVTQEICLSCLKVANYSPMRGLINVPTGS